MFLVLLLGACVFPKDDAPPPPLAPATAGPSGVGVPVNVRPWVVMPVRRPGPGEVEVRRPAAYREVKLVDRRGNEVPVRRIHEELPAATWLRLQPRAPLAAGGEYRIVVPGAVMVSFSTSAEADLAPPEGGGLRAWTWEGAPGCASIVLWAAPVVDATAVTWEVEFAGSGAPPQRILGVADGTGTGPLITLRDCLTGNTTIPRNDVDLKLRWVDAAGNPTAWSGPVRIPTSRDYGGEAVPAAVSSW